MLPVVLSTCAVAAAPCVNSASPALWLAAWSCWAVPVICTAPLPDSMVVVPWLLPLLPVGSISTP